MKRKDINETAADIMAQAVGDKPKAKKDKAAQAMGRKGGKARAEKLSPERRSQIAKDAATGRWGKKD